MVEKSGSLRIMVIKRFKSTSILAIYVIVSLFLALSTSCIPRTAFLKERWDKNPCVNISYWGKDWKKVPFEKRIQQAPAELIEKIRIENEVHGFHERPSPVAPPLEFFEAMDTIEASMPQNLKAILRESFIGLFAVKSLGGTGYADVVCDGAGNENYGLIVLDAEVLMGKKANEWATWKENSIFRPSSHGRVKLKAIIEEEVNNSAVNAVRFILLHEMGHVLGMLTRAHASWMEWFTEKKIRMDYPFQKLSWNVTKDNEIVSLFDDMFPERKLITIYSFEESRLSNEQIPIIYKKLHDYTNFPSLYAGQSLWEDFAESFAIYFHVVIDERPWQVIIEKEGEAEMIIGPCWDEERCKRKKDFIERWFKNPDYLQSQSLAQ